MTINYSEIEAKWRDYWQKNKTYKVDIDTSKEKYYVLDMFPYPSGAGLHVGHPLGYIASDIYSRYKRMMGYNVLHPMGYDAFGLPAEQYAIKTGVHPEVSTNTNIKRYREQLDRIGFSYDWDREVKTCDPSYYKWTQWIFSLLFSHYYHVGENKARPMAELELFFEQNGNQDCQAYTDFEGKFSAADWQQMSRVEQSETLMHYRLAYRQKTYVNWCEALGTVLANDEVKDGFSERGGHPVEKKAMLQWSLRITAYAERLLQSLNNLDWSDSLKAMQANWIGKSEGAQITFQVADHDASFEIFTTRPDTIFGATFMVLAPEHDLVQKISTRENEVQAYLDYVKTRSERDRMADVKTVTGAFTGAHAIHPISGKKLPIYIAEYVLKDYGTGAIMAVPSDDERDHRFAEKMGIDIIPVVDKKDHPNADKQDKVGVMINSDFLNGMKVKQAISAMINHVEKEGLGVRKINYKLRDANYSRQRYWGEPFPITYDQEGVAHLVDIKDLPVELPALENFNPGTGTESPLAQVKEWVHVEGGVRETDTMPGFAGSSWYFFRYMDADNGEAFAGKQALDYWKEVDLYIGGTEHAVGHLMYARFWCKFLYDLGYVKIEEPFKKLVNQGMIQGVIESVFLKKQKTNGRPHFLCAGLVKEEGRWEEYVPIPVHIDFIQEYGSDGSYMDQKSIEQFVQWLPEYKDAIFECSKGIYQNGMFSPKNDAKESHLITQSEVGKMSKSKFNVINPDDVVDQYGADVFRMYEMFLGPIEASKPWDIQGIDGVSKFLRRYVQWAADSLSANKSEAPTKEEEKILHQTIKKIRDGIERFAFNTCVSAFMIALNEFKSLGAVHRTTLAGMNRLLAPFAPYVTEEINARLGHSESVHLGSFPIFDETKVKEDSTTYPLSINGKKRGEATFPSEASKEEIEKDIVSHEVVQKWAEGKTIRKIIVVPGRMINVVVG